MKLIADSGSTKTTWVITEDGQINSRIITAGLNPYFHTSDSLVSLLSIELLPSLIPDQIQEIHFYGAGCSTENNQAMIGDALAIFFRKAEISISHDILGAARSLFGHEEGIAAILGTGCNSCYYDGRHCFSKVDSLGYLFGDEGGGSYLGKTLLGKFLKKELPEDLHNAFVKAYPSSLEDILNSVYNRPFPNRYLAGFSKFLEPLQQHPFVHQLVRNSFLAFFDAQIKQYHNYRELKISFVGSIAYYFKNILLEVAETEGIRTGIINKSPIDGLITFHNNS